MQYLGLIGFIIVLAATARWFWRAWAVNVPKTPYLFQSLLAAGLALGALSLLQGHQDPFAIWAVVLGVMLIFLTATGAQKVDEKSLNVGEKIPAFTAPDDNDVEFDSASLAGTRTLIKFFRGHW